MVKGHGWVAYLTKWTKEPTPLSEKFCITPLYCSLKRKQPLSAIDKGNQQKISKDEKPPIEHFLEWKNPMLEAIWPEARFLHVLRKETKLSKSETSRT